MSKPEQPQPIVGLGKPIVAIVGRPNVGKSTLFNRLVGQQIAIVEDLPGTTRDRLYADVEWGGRTFTVVDTGGLETEVAGAEAARRPYVEPVRAQAQIAIEEADAVVFLVDGREGALPEDLAIADILRQTRKPVILAVNKAETATRRLDAVEFYQLGLDEPIPISAYHGQGVGDLLDEVVQYLPRPVEVAEEADLVKVAIVGRPNVGKSLLLNRLLGQERVVVSEIPGTTRDAIDTPFEHEGQRYVLIDTAGIRRRGRIEPGIERYSVLRTLRAIDRCRVALLVMDATDPLTAQDIHIAGFIADAYKGVVVLMNKWDLIPQRAAAAADYTERSRAALNFMPYAPLLFISARTGMGVEHILPMVRQVDAERRKRVSTGQLNRLIEDALAEHAPPNVHGRRLRIFFVTQSQVEPPTIVFFCNDPTLAHFSYQRYLENRLRQALGFFGTPIRLVFRQRTAAERET
ncbi:MAG: ribosome biogenesis GTPase Der [Chloroflexi bacterium]|nr:ribosome biogenesis GTPase Der [Chloroflexota bacterium]